MGDHAVEALRPLWQDIALLAVPVVVASLVGALGIVLRRLPRWLCVSVICVATIAFIAPLLSVAGWAPSWLGEIVATLGGVTTIEAFVAAHLLCVVWVAPKRSLSAPFLAILIVAALFVVVIDNMAALRWRLAHANPDDAVWSNRCDDDGVLAQRTGATCAPASGAMLLYRYGISVSEGAIAYRAGTSAFGTDEYELADGIQSMLGGTAGRAEATHETAEEVIAGGAPCIVYIDTPLGCHAVLLEAVVNGQLDLVDPLGGVRETISSEEFATVFRGVVIRIGGLPRRLQGLVALERSFGLQGCSIGEHCAEGHREQYWKDDPTSEGQPPRAACADSDEQPEPPEAISERDPCADQDSQERVA